MCIRDSFKFVLAGDAAPARVGDGGDALFTRVPLDPARLPFTGGMEHMRRNVKVFKMLGAALFPWAHRLVWIDGKLRFGEEGPGEFFSEAVAQVGACAAFVGLPVHKTTFGARVWAVRRGSAPPALGTHTRTILEALKRRPNVTDDPELLREQACRYRRLSRAPQQLGVNLIDSALFARDLGSPRCARLNRRLGEAWLAAVQCGSDRDQVSFPFVLECMGVHETAAEAAEGTTYRRLNHRAGISPRVLVDTTGQPVLHIAPSGIEAAAKDAALPWHWYFSRRIAAWEL